HLASLAPSPCDLAAQLLPGDTVPICSFFCYRYRDHRDLPSFPTRRSSDLKIQVFGGRKERIDISIARAIGRPQQQPRRSRRASHPLGLNRKPDISEDTPPVHEIRKR